MKKLWVTNWIAIFALHSLFAGAQKPELRWVGTWAASPVGRMVGPSDLMPSDATYRNIIRASIGGPWLRARISNEYGQQSLTVAEAYVGAIEKGDALWPDSNHQLTFDGHSSVTIPAGGMVISDPAAMQVPALADLAVSVYLPRQPLTEMSCHSDSQATNFVARGNTAQLNLLNQPREVDSWCFVDGVDIGTPDTAAGTIVALGDSITDGWQSTVNGNDRWPDILAERLAAYKRTRYLSVLNEGISGNRLLRDGVGPNAIARFDRDVLSQAGVKYLIVLEGINDIGDVVATQNPTDEVSAQDIIFALSQLVVRAHGHGIKVFGATLTPYRGAGYFSEHGEQIREEVNRWIRSSGVFDGLVDFDHATRDPGRPTVLLPAFDSGDHLHPDSAGYRAMGSSIDLSLFE